MFIRLFDVRTGANMILPVRHIRCVKDYIVTGDGERIDGANAVVMTDPLGINSTKTFDYFVSETLTQVESLLSQAIDY